MYAIIIYYVTSHIIVALQNNGALQNNDALQNNGALQTHILNTNDEIAQADELSFCEYFEIFTTKQFC